ncbi:hypothetical protein FISHEDRAFT_60383 [Fistulina hepatica ATCC 64428]|uniref:Uncharacterized protein n=1 Tax=Fistulina hepatica ATCC 64428 TaxID=1128425 RepID=A0A0D7A7S0_9AGAR|nr:hypothetical protein FISHEDRAFT_60383 [Fistulina hepatica ATCC 64428]
MSIIARTWTLNARKMNAGEEGLKWNEGEKNITSERKVYKVQVVENRQEVGTPIIEMNNARRVGLAEHQNRKGGVAWDTRSATISCRRKNEGEDRMERSPTIKEEIRAEQMATISDAHAWFREDGAYTSGMTAARDRSAGSNAHMKRLQQ